MYFVFIVLPFVHRLLFFVYFYYFQVLMHKSLYEAALISCCRHQAETHRQKIIVEYDLECTYCNKRISNR